MPMNRFLADLEGVKDDECIDCAGFVASERDLEGKIWVILIITAIQTHLYNGAFGRDLG